MEDEESREENREIIFLPEGTIPSGLLFWKNKVLPRHSYTYLSQELLTFSTAISVHNEEERNKEFISNNQIQLDEGDTVIEITDDSSEDSESKKINSKDDDSKETDSAENFSFQDEQESDDSFYSSMERLTLRIGDYVRTHPAGIIMAGGVTFILTFGSVLFWAWAL